MAHHAHATTLVLLRHGDAGEPLSNPELDARRALTPRGRKQARRAGKALHRMGFVPHEVWTSRLRRAAETLTVAMNASGGTPHVVRSVTLLPDADPERTAKALAHLADPAPDGAVPAPRVRWLVGHDPHLTRLLAFLLGTEPDALRLSKGSFAVVSLDERGPAAGAGTLEGLVSAAGLKAIRRKRTESHPRKKRTEPPSRKKRTDEGTR